MNKLILRVGALLLHLFLNIVIISWLTNFDITGSWVKVFGFVVTLFILLVLLIRHILSFITFLKN